MSCLQKVEREMVNALHELGWDAFMLHPPFHVHTPAPEGLPARHGVTIMQRFRKLPV
jgi:hypothetical protein